MSAVKAFMNILHSLSVFLIILDLIWEKRHQKLKQSGIRGLYHVPCAAYLVTVVTHQPNSMRVVWSLQVFICIDKVERTQGEVLPPTT